MNQNAMNIKAIIIGDGTVGKTSLRRTYMGQSFQQNYLITIGADFSLKKLDLEGGEAVRFQLWDLAGQHSSLKSITKHCMGAIGAIAVYDRTNRESAENLEMWITHYFENSGFEGRKNPILILGNKSDLNYERDFITDREHVEIVNKMRTTFPSSSILGMTTSALTGENVDTAFNYFGQLCYNWIVNDMQKYQKKEENFEINFPFASLFTVNSFIGPHWVASSPSISELDESKAQSTMIKLIVSMNEEELADMGTIEGQTPWPEPDCVMMYLGFGLPNPEARGGYEMYMLGLGVSKEILKEVEPLRIIIDGMLQSTMNEFSTMNMLNDYNLVNKQMAFDGSEREIPEIVELLHGLRKKAQEMLFDDDF